MDLRNWVLWGGVFLVLFAVVGCESEPTADVVVEPVADVESAAVADVVEVKGAWVMMEGRLLKNDVEVSKPAIKTMSGHLIDMATQAWDKDGESSHILIELTPVVVGKDEVEVKGEVSVAPEDGAKDRVVARVDERVSGDGVVKVPVALKEDEYVFEFRFSVVE